MKSYRGEVSYQQPADDQWVSLVDDFVIVYCVSQPWVTSSIFVAPNSNLADGLMYLLMVKKSALNRFQFLQLMLGFESAAHADFDFVDFFPVKGFRLKPISKGSYITVDGEVIEHASIQAEILPKAVQILTTKNQ